MKLLPVAVLLYLVVALVWPTLRTWRRAGVFPVVFHREAEAAQRMIGALMGLFLAGLVVWSALCGAMEPRQLGIWQLAEGWQALGWLLFAGGLFFSLAAQAQMGASWRVGIDDRTTQLVTHGLFARSRNPIFLGMLLSLAGVALITPARWTAAGFAVAVILVSLQVRLEERNLFRIHGREYAAYAARVGRFLPWLGRIRIRGRTPAREPAG